MNKKILITAIASVAALGTAGTAIVINNSKDKGETEEVTVSETLVEDSDEEVSETATSSTGSGSDTTSTTTDTTTTSVSSSTTSSATVSTTVSIAALPVVTARPVTNTEAVPANISEDTWHSLYRERLREYLTAPTGETSNSDYAFELQDLNGDGLPELIVSKGQYTAASAEIYTINNNTLVPLGETGVNGLISYSEKYNLILSSLSRWGNTSCVFEQIIDGTLEEIANFSNTEMMYTDRESAEYWIDDNETGRDNFYGQILQYGVYGSDDYGLLQFDEDYESYGRAYRLSQEQVDGVFPENSQPEPEPEPEPEQNSGAGTFERLPGTTLADMSLLEIVQYLNNEYTLKRGELDHCFSITNDNLSPGVEFCFTAYDASKLSDVEIRSNIESGQYQLSLIQISSGASYYATDSIRSDFTLAQCRDILGSFGLHGGPMGWLGGDVSAGVYTFNDGNNGVTLCFKLTDSMTAAWFNSGAGRSDPDEAQLTAENPSLVNVLVYPTQR